MKLFALVQLAFNGILAIPADREFQVVNDAESHDKIRIKRSSESSGTETLMAEIKTVDDSFCAVPKFPLAKNIDCTDKLTTGEYCDHMCGGTTVRSTCAESYEEAFGLKIYTGRVLMFDNECIIKVVERESRVIGFSAIAESRDKCKEYVETSVAPKLEEKLLQKCSNECEVKIECDCQEVKRKRRSTHVQFDISLGLTVMALNEEVVAEVTVEDIQKTTEEVITEQEDSDVELVVSQVKIDTEDIEVKTEIIQPVMEKPEVQEETEERIEDGVSEDKSAKITEDEIDERIQEAVEDATAPLEDKIDSLEDENLDLFVKIKLLENEMKVMESNFEDINSKMRKNQLYHILQNGQSQSEMINVKTEMTNLKTKVGQIMTDLYDGFFNNFGQIFQ